MDKCIEYELTHWSERDDRYRASVMSNFSSVTGVNGTKHYRILSKNTWDLLDECALRWRVPSGFKSLQYINSIRLRFDTQAHDRFIKLEHIKEGFLLLRDATRRVDIPALKNADVCVRERLFHIYIYYR